MKTRYRVFPAMALVLAGLLAGVCPGAADLLQFTHVQRIPGGLSLQWNSAGGDFAYTVQAREGWGNPLWLLPAASQPWPVTETAWVAPVSAPARFYRVIAVPAAARGKLLHRALHSTLATNQIAPLLELLDAPLTAEFDVQLYTLAYETIDPLGARTVATAAMALPVGAGECPLISYQHGTLTRTNEAPSAMNLYGEPALGVVLATSGYACVLPDYLGLGGSPGLHPYHHARSEATACVDALRAARALCAERGVALNGQLFLVGYSQGGHATMALHRELEMYHTAEFTITASAPMAGAYDLSGVTTADTLSGRPQPNPYYFAYLLAAYQAVYHLAPTLGDLLRPPYRTTLPPLFNGTVSGAQINAALPANPLDILQPAWLADFRTNAHHVLRQALRDNDLWAWAPQRPMRLYHCASDQDVVPANSAVAWAEFHQRGATQVELLDPDPTADHTDCIAPSLLSAKAWFDSLRQ